MMVRQPGFFDVEERLRELSAKGDDLQRLSAPVDVERSGSSSNGPFRALTGRRVAGRPTTTS